MDRTSLYEDTLAMTAKLVRPGHVSNCSFRIPSAKYLFQDLTRSEMIAVWLTNFFELGAEEE